MQSATLNPRWDQVFENVVSRLSPDGRVARATEPEILLLHHTAVRRLSSSTEMTVL